MRTFRIPSALHDVFGERQSAASLTLIALAMPVAVLAALPAFLTVEPWRAVLAGLLVADIAAGAIANFTRSTNDHYAASALRRTVFLVVHVHIFVVALLLDLPIIPALVAWALTIAAATAVVLLKATGLQRPVAGMGVVVVLGATAMTPEATMVLLFMTALFAIKVVLAFAIDHSADTGP
ncbi:MAG: hypothetical protein KIT89_09510 [Microcella sp.]|uniref:hypothetical protein n=1 Tax=Microcella sp. TaxID=1913979 RepID=UPI0024C7362E|nr:hypothetical protein [Microcella sp.]UYN82942.1 MAG: hypothetical protein KIT89_09510 [Microcella sp.]